MVKYRDNDLKVMRLVKMWRNLTEDYKGKLQTESRRIECQLNGIPMN